MKKIPVILAGGRGERFWPLSRAKTPKQILSLMSDKPMILETYKRLESFGNFYIIANKALCESFQPILPDEVGYIIEPMARNTAPAIGLACAFLQKKHGDCVVFFETADHYYQNPEEYVKIVRKACEFAEIEDKIVLIGIKPDSPHTGYGYIEQGEKIADVFYSVCKFKEKPDYDTAVSYLEKGTFSWNSGMFIAKTSVLLNEISKYLPKLGKILSQLQDVDFQEPELTELFQNAPKISIDHGVMEKSDQTVVLKADLQWDDIGDFNAIARHFKGDEEGNIIRGKGSLKALESSDNIIISDKLVVLIGIENLVVVETDDALLICDRNETQKIKEIVRKIDEKYK